MDIWPVIHAERKALAGDLGSLQEDRWSTPSLCTEWTVRDVLAHMAATAKMSPAGFFVKIAGSGFNFGKMQSNEIAAEKGASGADTLAAFEAIVTSTGHPPGPADTMLGETIVHGEDIRRALGLTHAYPTDAVVQAADFFKRSNLIIGTKRRISGLKLRATDTLWSTGDGPEVAGPILDLLMAMTGRKSPDGVLTGDGVESLASRP
ncbi:MAG TPA: maleylpyruvate isomerase family mycothiol-dependent enzyme [Streptosporangiaceae bacterium]|nr:maleylpyruvate isomerase family mycothiol-dependent enzyme [Streptosporangiaceae bacterium]